MSYQTELVSVKDDGVEFVDIRKPELDLFESLKKSGMPHLEFCKSPTEKIVYVWISVYLTEALMRNCSGKLVRSVIPQCGISPKVTLLILLKNQNSRTWHGFFKLVLLKRRVS